jgi:hypothetical protein
LSWKPIGKQFVSFSTITMPEKHDIEHIGQELEVFSTVDTTTKEPNVIKPSKATRRKIDVRLIVTVGIVYALSVIDRINIGQVSTIPASHTGFDTDHVS